MAHVNAKKITHRQYMFPCPPLLFFVSEINKAAASGGGLSQMKCRENMCTHPSLHPQNGWLETGCIFLQTGIRQPKPGATPID